MLGGLEIDPGLEARLRGGLPELPDEPTPGQVEAWVELAELVRDPDFRARIREMAEAGAAERERGEAPDGEAMHTAAALVAERGGAARRGAGRSMLCVRGRGRSPVPDYRSRANERYGGAYPLRCRLAARRR